ncbi:MAG: polysaccharide deacetylase family protein [Chloroflexi bacterium]|nr:polysaccharide deacetylase family protein [Chloroflexota bacterium]
MSASFLRSVYQSLPKRRPGILFSGNISRPEIALTFDDGPHPRDTPRVLDVLARHNVCATFFLIGMSAEQYPQLVRQIHQGRHQLALHCYRHLPFPLESASTLKGQLDHSRIAIARACGISPETIRHVRPPYGFFTAKTLSLLEEWGYRLVLWDNMPLHFLQPARRTIAQILERTAPGSVIVLHDGKGHGAKVAHILEIVLPRLKAKGFEFVTIEQMQSSSPGGGAE